MTNIENDCDLKSYGIKNKHIRAPQGAIFSLNIFMNALEELQRELDGPDRVLGSIHIDSHTIYIPTLKCANNWCQDLLLEAGYTKTHSRTADRVLIVVRDPIQRWVSGIVTYLRIWHKSDRTPSALRYSLDTLLDRSLTPDLHTTPQSVYVQHLDADQLLAFDMATVEQTLPKYLNINVEPHRYRNSTAEHDFMRWAHQIVAPLSVRYGDRLREIYSSDYALLSKVQYQTNI
jgi:hypothetical protein